MGKDICRLCCKTTEPPVKSHEIFNRTGKLKERIQDLLPIELSEDDHDLPKLICDDCFKALESFLQFRVSSVANDELLRSLPLNNHRLVTFVSTIKSSSACELQEETVIDDRATVDIVLSEEVSSCPTLSSNNCVYFQSPSGHHCRDADDEAMQLMITWENMSKSEQLMLGNNIQEFKIKLPSKEKETACILKCISTDVIKETSKIIVDTNDLNVPKKYHQLAQRVQEFRCAECEKVFRKRDTFTEHMLLIHLGKNPFKYTLLKD